MRVTENVGRVVMGTRAGLVLALTMLLGCSTALVLTDRGARVQRVTQADVPPGCRVLGDVPIGVAPDASRPRTEDELVLLMRNKAGEGGASHIVVDSSERRSEEGAEPYYVGRARSYSCPAGRPAAPREQPTAGGEEGGEESGEEGEESGSDDLTDEAL
jgi:hypothetical protein